MDAFTTNEYANFINDVAQNRVGGSGAELTAVLAATGRIYSGVIVAGGADYSVDDVLTVTQGGGSGGTFTVTSVDEDGAVTGIALTTPGTGYTSATGLATTVVPSGGSGATITTVVERAIASVTVVDGGEDYLIANVSIATTNGSGGVLTPVLDDGVIDSVTVTAGGWYRVVPALTVVTEPWTGAQMVSVLRDWDTARQDSRLIAALIDSQFVNVGTPRSTIAVTQALAALTA